MQSTKGRNLHSKAAQARESGKHLSALKFQDEAMLAYQKDGDILGLSEIIADRYLVLFHLFGKTQDKNFLVIAKHEMMASVEIAEASDNKQALAMPYFNLAKAQESLGEFQEAIKSYQLAVENMLNNPPAQHNRPAILADMMIHLSTCEYKSGDKSGLERSIAALVDLEGADEVKYNKDVWLSGAQMRIAEMLIEDDPDKAKEHLQMAKDIIDANPDLTIRLEQWKNLAKKFKD